jgi:plastocyanin
MAAMHPLRPSLRFALPLGVALILAACSGAGPGWTYAPLGPTAAPTAAASSTPAASPSGDVVTLSVKTTEANPLAFDPTTLEAPANTTVTVNYLNDSSLPHNIAFLNGADQSAPILAKTDIPNQGGPGQQQSVTFTTPTAAGDYFFFCQVHGASMSGTLHVTP